MTPWLPTLLLVVALVGALIYWRRRFEVASTQLAGLQGALFNSMIEGVLLLDKAGRVELVNESFKKLFGVSSDIRGQTILEALRLPELAELLKRLPEERSVNDYELELPGIEDRWVQLNAAAIMDAQGAHRGAILVFHD